MEQKYKCHNRNKYDVGIQLMESHRQMNIKPGSFVLLTADEISFVNSISTIFSGKDLSVDEPEIREGILGFTSEDVTHLTSEEIQTILKSAVTKMKASLETITDENFKYLIFEEAKSMYSELTGAKIEFIANYCGKDAEDLKPVKTEDKTEIE